MKYTSTLADPVRLQQFALLCGSTRPFQRHVKVHDGHGKAWACVRIGGQLFAVPAARLQKGLSFGVIAERVLWLMHAEVRNQRIPQIEFPRPVLYGRIWGDSLTRKSAQTLRETLRGLAELRVAEWPADQDAVPFEQSLPLFEQIFAEPDRYVFVVGNGLLGSLEQFVAEENGGLVYKFPTAKALKDLRAEQRVQDVYLPIYLGHFAACKRFAPRQKRLFQAVTNEVTCPPRSKAKSDTKRVSRALDQAMVTCGDMVVGYNGSGTTECPYLKPLVNYVGFNGNGVRRGHGYKLGTWMTKAGYGEEELLRFLDDLTLLSNALGLIVAAIGRGPGNWYSLSRLASLARTGMAGGRKLDGLHVRIYATADCLER
jgi:hypothetical protein